MDLLDFTLRYAFIVDENDYLGLDLKFLSAHLRYKKNIPPLIDDANPRLYYQNKRTVQELVRE